MRGLSFEIRADAKLGKPVQTDGQSQSVSENEGQNSTGIQARRSVSRCERRFGIKNSARQTSLVRTTNSDQLHGSFQKKLSRGAYMSRDRIWLERT
jgi:hypothetical protein